MSEEQLENNEQVEVESEPVVIEEVAQKKSRTGLIFGIVNLVLIFSVAGGGYFLLQSVEDKQTHQGSNMDKSGQREIEASKQLSTFQSQLATMQTQIATFNQELTGKDNHFTETLSNFSKLHTSHLESTKNELTTEITRIKRQLGKTRGDWLIADAEYLLSVASQRLHLVGDVETAIMALEAADQRLRESEDASVFSVREQVAKEVALLRDVPAIDVVGTYSAIQSLKDQMPQLAVLLPYAGKPLTESKQVHQHEEKQQADHGMLNSALHVFEGYVTVKHSDEPITHILTEEEAGFILQQLGVKLEMVKIALVQQNDPIYKSSIADATQWLKENFTANTQFNSFITQLDQLNKIQLRSKLPDVSLSLKMIKDITKLRVEADKGQLEAPAEDAPENQLEVEIEPISLTQEEPILALPDPDSEQPSIIQQPVQEDTEAVVIESATP